MEYLIRLSGVQLGPYSEQQVRQHIEEGLLTLNDLAKHEGMADWAPLSEVLGPAPEPDEAASPQQAPPPTQPEPPAQDEPEEAANEPIRAPSVPPGGRHLPTRHQEADLEPPPTASGSLGKKTIPIGPTAPGLPSSTSAGHTTVPITTTTPLASTNQSTKKVSRAALVKALANNTSPLPTKAINAPPRPPVATPDATAPDPQVPDKASPSGLVRALTAKTVPMRNTPAAPPLTPAIQTTEPLPTRSIFKPASGTFPPTAKQESPAGSQSAPKAPPVPELEVATVKIPPPVFAKDEKPGPPTKPAPPVADQPPVEAAPPAPPKPPRRFLPKIIAAWAVLAAFMLYYVWSPYHAAANLRSALDNGDVAGLNAAVDFPSVRESLKAQVAALASASSTAPDMLQNSIETYVTPEMISALVNKADSVAPSDQTQLISPDQAAKAIAAFNSQPVNGEGLASVSDFVLDRGTTWLHLHFTGLGWKLSRIEFRPDMTAPASPGSVAPLLSPVVDTFLERGTAKAKNGDGSGAIADFTQALAIDPQSGAAYNQRAAIRQAKGDLDGAIADYTHALTIDPQMAAAFNGRGNARAAKNDQDGAIADFTQAVHFDPTLAVAYDSRGNARIAKNDVDGAIADFTQAVSIDPSLASAYSDRGFARQANGNLDGAIADYNQALALKPKTARDYFKRGLAWQAQGNLSAAILDFGRALDFDPKIADAYYYRGNARSANNDTDGAIADYTQAIALTPKNANAYSNRGFAHQLKGDLDGAVADYTQALTLDPKIGTAFFNRAVIEAQRNDLDDAIADSTQALYLDPKNAQAYSTRGFAKLTKGNLDGALSDLKQFCDLAPRDHDTDHARLYLWLIAKAQNSGADADQDLSSALESSWNSPPDDMATKTASFLLGRTSETDFLAAAASPDAKLDQAQHCEAWYFAGMKRLLMGDKNGAIQAFQTCVATNQKDFVEFVLAQAELQALQPATPASPAPATATTPPAKIPAPPKTP